ncbi:MAG: hypothetical protein AAF404_13430 [Pseudomonadota bacterium]
MPSFNPQQQLPAGSWQSPDQAELLRNQCRQRLQRFLSDHNHITLPHLYTRRLEEELSVIEQQNFCSYFLIVADYVQWAKDQGIAVGPGRGSGPCSLVGFTLGITAIDPIKHQLPFERFVNPERNALPDFDIDFCDERRMEVIDYLLSRYGNDRVAHISNASTSPRRSRLVICDRPLTNVASLYTSVHTPCPAIDMTVAQISDAGLVQFNVINQIALTIIQRTTQQLARQGIHIDIGRISLDDQHAYALLAAGEPSNIAMMDTDAYFSTLQTIKPARFTDMCAVIALSQPHLQGRLLQFARRLHQTESTEYFHASLESITRDTCGLVLYQEQLMSIAYDIAGFSLARGDLLRRALQHADYQAIQFYRTRFIIGANSRGLSAAEAAGLFEYLAMYGNAYFNKSHALAYATLAYQAAWLKANYADTYTKVKAQTLNKKSPNTC